MAKQYIWHLGTTTFRRGQLNIDLEKSLIILNELWENSENTVWDRAKQGKFEDFLNSNGVVQTKSKKKNDQMYGRTGRAVVTSLKALGMVDKDAQITSAGKEFLSILKKSKIKDDNIIKIKEDSFLMFCQLLKYSVVIDDEVVRPLLVTLYLLNKYEYLSQEERIYLLPFAINKNSLEEVEKEIAEYRKNKKIEKSVIRLAESTPNFLEEIEKIKKDDSKEVFLEALNHGKGKKEGEKYYGAFKEIVKGYSKRKCNITKLLSELNKISKGKRNSISKRLIGVTALQGKRKQNEIEKYIEKNFYRFNSEYDVRKEIIRRIKFQFLLDNLEDYADINRRYLALTGIFTFDNSEMRYDTLPKLLFYKKENDLLKDVFNKATDCEEVSKLNDILSFAVMTEKTLIKTYNVINKTKYTTIKQIEKAIHDEKIKKFDKLVDTKFTKTNILKLLDYFKNHEKYRDEIGDMISDQADTPTNFEYLVGVIWYELSERKGNILEFIKTDRTPDLLPKSHATGGQADIEYVYEKTKDYPKHAAIIEATLMSPSAQKLNEDEPLRRHLASYIFNSGLDMSYGVLIANRLAVNLISSLRNHKTLHYYESDTDTSDKAKHIKGLTTVSLDIDDLKEIVEKRVKYKDLHEVFMSIDNDSSILPNQVHKETTKRIKNI